MVGISDPALVAGGDAIILYFGIVAPIGASVFGWLYVNHKRKAKKELVRLPHPTSKNAAK